MLPLIAVTAGEITDYHYPWAPVAYGKAHTYTDSITNAGGVPILMPLIDDKKKLRRLYDACDGILLTGGNDIDPIAYKAKPSERTSNTSPRRDTQEFQLIEWALEDNKPILGICRGMQLINVHQGGSLYQHIGDDLPHANNHEESAHKEDFNHLAHTLTIDEDSKLAKVLGVTTLPTNGLHHQAVCDLGEGLVATAHAEDGIIEAIEMPSRRFVVAVQSHPEALESGAEPRWRKLFEAFVDSCRV